MLPQLCPSRNAYPLYDLPHAYPIRVFPMLPKCTRPMLVPYAATLCPHPPMLINQSINMFKDPWVNFDHLTNSLKQDIETNR